MRRWNYQLDAIDQQIIQLLSRNGRLSNSAIAQATAIAESTCHNRIKALVEAGIIKGFHAEVDTAALGRPIQAVILVKVRSTARDRLLNEAQRLAKADGVTSVLFFTGNFDLLSRLAVPDPAALRDFVVRELSASPAVATTETSVIMEEVTGEGLVPIED
jgi:DNA-binding Lrp family transcriptional regulator